MVIIVVLLPLYMHVLSFSLLSPSHMHMLQAVKDGILLQHPLISQYRYDVASSKPNRLPLTPTIALTFPLSELPDQLPSFV